MDPPAAAIHPQDPASYIFQQAQYALQTSPNDPWSNPASYSPPAPAPESPTLSRSAKSKPYARPPGHSSRLTRTRAAALARQSQDDPPSTVNPGASQESESAPEHHHSEPSPLQPYAAQAYTPSGYLNTHDDQPTQDPVDPLVPSPDQSFTSPVQVYHPAHYHLNFPADVPASPSPPNSSSSNGPSHPPLHPQHSPIAFAASNGYAPHMMVHGASTAGAPFPGGLDDAGTVYGSSGMSRGTEDIRLPSASPSIASGELGSPGPEDYIGGHARSSSSHYDYSGSGGPISPLSSSYAPQPLPSAFSSVTGGYLHGPPSAPTASAGLASGAFPGANTTADTDPIPSTLSSRGRSGQKTKTKLTDMDRKFICVFAQNHPKARQEDIATKFAVERSTVSKILKCKEKWMKVDFFSSEARVVKHRPSKFPELESTLIHHIRMRIAQREPVNDAFIKKMALELADERGIGRDKFKASSGWVENFKHRHDLRKGGSWGTGATKYQPATPASAPAPGPADDAIGDNTSPFENAGEFVTEESNPLDEANQHRSANQNQKSNPSQVPSSLGLGPQHRYHHGHRQDRSGSIGGFSDSDFAHPASSYAPSEAGSFASPASLRGNVSLQVNTSIANPAATRLGSISPHGGGGGLSSFLHPHISTPRSMSRSTSSASLNSLGATSSVGAQSQFSPGAGGSPPQFSFAVPPSPFHHGHALSGVAHGHRRSMSASYTASPLSVEVGAANTGDGAMPLPASPGGRQRLLALDQARAANRRSVTFTSFSAMAAGLSLGSANGSPRLSFGDEIPPPSHYPHHGHSRSLSSGSKIQVPLPLFEQDEQHSPHSPFHARTTSASTSSTLVHTGGGMMPGSTMGEKVFSDSLETSSGAENMMGFIDTTQHDDGLGGASYLNVSADAH